MSPNTHADSSDYEGIKDNVVKTNSKGYTLESTFPNLKSSGLRGIPFPNIFDWLKGMFDDNLMTNVLINIYTILNYS